LSKLKDANFSAACFVQVRHNLICTAKFHYCNEFHPQPLKQNFIVRGRGEERERDREERERERKKREREQNV
jgi:hypothetical protein